MQTEDVSTEFMVKFWPWLEANRKRLVIAGVVALAVLFVWFYMKTSREQRELAAGQAYTQFQLDQPPTLATQQVVDGYLGIAKKYSGTVAAQRAELQAAATLFDAGRYADAQKQFEGFLRANAGGSLALMARLGVAACLESQGKLEEALSLYRQLQAGNPDTAEGINASFSMGRILELQGKLADAVTAYQQIMRSPLGGSLAQEAASRAAMLQTKLAAQKPAATTTKS
jgi:predicted negative regulator of RcsB-dependent stress response